MWCEFYPLQTYFFAYSRKWDSHGFRISRGPLEELLRAESNGIFPLRFVPAHCSLCPAWGNVLPQTCKLGPRRSLARRSTMHCIFRSNVGTAEADSHRSWLWWILSSLKSHRQKLLLGGHLAEHNPLFLTIILRVIPQSWFLNGGPSWAVNGGKALVLTTCAGF
jgi:hypothetical protein